MRLKDPSGQPTLPIAVSEFRKVQRTGTYQPSDLRALPEDCELRVSEIKNAVKLLREKLSNEEELDTEIMHPTPEQAQDALRSGWLLVLLLELLLRGEQRGEIHDLGLDLADAVGRSFMDSHIQEMASLAEDLIISQGSQAQVLPLSPQDLRAAQARLTACALERGVTLPAQMQEGTELYVEPDPNVPLLRERPLCELRPHGDDPQLAQWLSEAPSELEQAAILVAWWVRQRGSYENAQVGALLGLGGVCLSVAQDIRREQKLPQERCSDIKKVLEGLRQELRDESGHPLRVSTLRRPTPVRREMRGTMLTAVRSALSEFYREQGGYVSPTERSVSNMLWQSFDDLDRVLRAGRLPEDNPHFKNLLLFSALSALCQTYRAPGMRMPLIVELAAEMSGLDPLWEWKFAHEQFQSREQLIYGFGLVNLALRAMIVAAEKDQEDAFTALGQAGGHLLALCRSLGLRLPQADELGQFLLADHPRYGRRSALPDQDRDRLMTRLQEIYWDGSDPEPGDESGSQSGPEEDLAPAAQAAPEAVVEETQGETYPAHVLEARRLLAGRPITLLAGIRKAHHKEALEKALGVSVDWIESGEYDHGQHAASRVQQETGVVVLGIRWMAHAHNGLRDVAREKGVPCVLHPGGLSASSVAYQILQQAGRQLAASQARAPGPQAEQARAGKRWSPPAASC